mgnify:CR=1 FL=1
MTKLKITLKLGKFLFPSKLDVSLMKTYVETFRRMVGKGEKLLLVTGGGEAAREYIKAAREAGIDESACDQLGIEISRINAYFLIQLLQNLAYPEVPTTIKELKEFFYHGKIVVMGGLTPGHSTMAVGALAAEAIGADCYIIASDVDGIYTSDPKIHKEAKKFEVISTDEAFKIASEGRIWAGTYEIDPIAIKIIERSKIPAYFIDGRNPKNLEKVLTGEKIGTYIKPS